LVLIDARILFDSLFLSVTQVHINQAGGVMQNIKLINQTNFGEEYEIGDITITPQSRAIGFRWRSCGFILIRPDGITVREGDVQRFIRVNDLTRLIQFSLFGLSSIFILSSLFLSRKQRKVSHEE
jgi:hypothetical protein